MFDIALATIGAILAIIATVAALYVAGLNWVWLVKHRGVGSPVLLAGPLLAAIAGGSLATAFPDAIGGWAYLVSLLLLCVDPAALPLLGAGLVALVWRKDPP